MNNYGLLKDKKDKRDFMFGAHNLPEEVLVWDGDWRNVLPFFEHQKKSIESMACVSFSINNALEMIHRVRYISEPNYSDRYLAKASDTSRQGTLLARWHTQCEKQVK